VMRGLGQDCSTNPCTWWDLAVYPSDSCAAWYATCQPNSAFNQLTTNGLIVGGSAVLGQTANSAVSSFGNSLLGTGSGTGGIPAWVFLAGLAVAGFLAFEAFK